MAVVTKYGRAYPDPSTYKLPDALYASPVESNVMSDVAIANGDSATSQIFVCKVPSRARIDPSSLLYHTAITGLNSLHLGFPNNNASTAVLASALDLTSAGSKSMVNAVAAANLHKRVWELCGYTSDPGGEFDLIATMNAGASAAGTINFNLRHQTRGG